MSVRVAASTSFDMPVAKPIETDVLLRLNYSLSYLVRYISCGPINQTDKFAIC